MALRPDAIAQVIQEDAISPKSMDRVMMSSSAAADSGLTEWQVCAKSWRPYATRTKTAM